MIPRKKFKKPKAINFVGSWEILHCSPTAANIYPKGIQGVKFHLSQAGEVTWKVPSVATPMVLFKCENYEVLPRSVYLTEYLRFGPYNGHAIECAVRANEPDLNTIKIDDGWCQLTCRKFEDLNYEDLIQVPFSFLPALQDGYFSDLVFTSNNNKQFNVHNSILKLTDSEINWSSNNNPLSKLPDDVVSTILHFLYAQCLPEGLDENCIERILSAVSEIPQLDGLATLCHLYIKNVTFKNRIFSLISDICTCASQLNKYFSREDIGEKSDPAKLCSAVKNSFQEVAVAGSKLFLICDLYSKHKGELPKYDEHEIFTYVKSKIPVVVKELKTFLELVKLTFSSLSLSKRQELTSYLVQEIETIFDAFSLILVEMKTILETLLAESTVEKKKYWKNLTNPEQYANKYIFRRKMDDLKYAQLKLKTILIFSSVKKKNMKLMSTGNKLRSIAKDLEQLIKEDLPVFLIWADAFTTALENKFKHTESHFCLKVGIDQVNEIVKKLVARKETLQGMWTRLCDLVQRDAFAESLIAMGLRDSCDSMLSVEDDSFGNTPCQTSKFNTKDTFCVPPPAHRNRLSQPAYELLQSAKDTDMVFEIINNGDSDNATDSREFESRPKFHKIPAHRVIVSARCDWFRKALLSGMKESINRKIQVYDTTPKVFWLLLKYLYCGQLDCSCLSFDQLSELLLLSDRYELDSLKRVCEFGLKSSIDVDSVIYCFGLADRFNATALREACEEFIAHHPEVMEDDLFEELPDNLQSEIYDLLSGGKPTATDLSVDEIFSTNCEVEDIKEMFRDLQFDSNLCSPETGCVPEQDSSRLEEALERLQEVVGEEMSRSEMIRVILAADYDVNRALNFYFSSN